MLQKVESDLKEAILTLPEKEKDKLLIRLIRKDKPLINQLHFQLLEDEDDLEERREKTLERVNLSIQDIKTASSKRRFQSRQLLVALRSTSGYVNEHLLITKDKLGEIDLRLHILSEIFDLVGNLFQYENYDNDKLLKYTCGRIKNIYASYEKLHEDLQYDYRSRLNDILEFGYSSALKDYLKEIKIPREV